MQIEELQTPALLVEAEALEHNLSEMATACPGAPAAERHAAKGIAHDSRGGDRG
jgi:D-serine deaminase-like pyridoxal phosphate-dependent protein